MALVLSVVMIFLSVGETSFISVSAETARTEYVEATTLSGKIMGVKENGISIFKGIPYAKAPVGELRFAPPVGIEPWTGVLDCVNFGPQCPQNMPKENQAISEDCLNLNVWTPANRKKDEKLPIYVYIHGGAGAVGSSADPLYSGEGFAQKGIVYFSIQYRVNALGWFASNETLKQYGTTGNWGLLDQIEALKWIKKNASLFGGDPNNITVGGESFGAFSNSALILSPLAEGLFQRVIMESGTILGNGGCDRMRKVI
ncbi:carboxylic ester hydrolase [Holotrichia oblita]|nr:carboxylic ester hydrolase [Holotrichia oblita]